MKNGKHYFPVIEVHRVEVLKYGPLARFLLNDRKRTAHSIINKNIKNIKINCRR